MRFTVVYCPKCGSGVTSPTQTGNRKCELCGNVWREAKDNPPSGEKVEIRKWSA